MHELRRIALIDDDDDIREIAQLALADVGGLDVQAYAGMSSFLAAPPEPAVDLVLLDVMMPDMDGPTGLQALRRLAGYEHTPVVFMTARSRPQDTAALRALGARDVVVKPFDPMTLADTLRRIVAGG